MTASVNLKYVSPSSVGSYAACPGRLVLDTDFPPPYESSGYADFGTLAHYLTMFKLGLNPVAPKDQAELEASARSLYKTDNALFTALDRATDRAVAETPKLTVPVLWVCEREVYQEKLLPERVSRSGQQGFGGYVDIMASDRSQLWDYKFVSRAPEKAKLVYLWQIAAYHLLTDVPKCGLLFVTRDGRNSRKLLLDFREERWALFAKSVSSFIRYTGHADFRRNAWFVAGAHCDDGFCSHRGTPRCPVYNEPTLSDADLERISPSGDISRLLELTAPARIELL